MARYRSAIPPSSTTDAVLAVHRLVGDGEACRGSAKTRHLRAGIELVTAVSSSASPLLSSANARKTHGVNETGSTPPNLPPLGCPGLLAFRRRQLGSLRSVCRSARGACRDQGRSADDSEDSLRAVFINPPLAHF